MIGLTTAKGLAQPILTSFPPHTELYQTLCILRVPRGGTSMAAGLARQLGLPTGEDVHPANVGRGS